MEGLHSPHCVQDQLLGRDRREQKGSATGKDNKHSDVSHKPIKPKCTAFAICMLYALIQCISYTDLDSVQSILLHTA